MASPAFMDFLRQWVAFAARLKRIAIDGDLAFVHVRYLKLFGRKPQELTSPLRRPGKIVEHWDVLRQCQPSLRTQTRCSDPGIIMELTKVERTKPSFLRL